MKTTTLYRASVTVERIEITDGERIHSSEVLSRADLLVTDDEKDARAHCQSALDLLEQNHLA